MAELRASESDDVDEALALVRSDTDVVVACGGATSSESLVSLLLLTLTLTYQVSLLLLLLTLTLTYQVSLLLLLLLLTLTYQVSLLLLLLTLTLTYQDRADLKLDQHEFLLELTRRLQTGPNRTDDASGTEARPRPRLVVLALAPGTVLMPWADKADAAMVTFLAGEQSGNAWADVLLGEVNPSP